jgi:hypothetical protein
MEPTVDPSVFIEEKRANYVRYWRESDGKRWEVHGECIHLGNCMIGAVLKDGTEIRDLDHLSELVAEGRVPESEFDVPVGPGFEGCCPLEIVELS